ncbi:MAG: hypothetical protein E7632_12865 [Ruminococcaceae bacterium]|nr:hypothetical protein [Oscillospiraceae bacterium]
MAHSPAPLHQDSPVGTAPARPRRREPDINEYYRKTSQNFRYAKYLTIALLVIFLIFSFTFLRGDITLENLRYLMKFISFTSAETSISVPRINYSSGDPNRLELFAGDLATLTQSGYALYDSRGNQIMAEDFGLSEPILKVSDRFVLCFDLGGTQFTILNSFAKLYEGSSEYPVTDADIADNGTFAIASGTREYRTMVTLYDEDFKPVSRVMKNDHLMAVELKADGSEAAIMTSGTDGGSFYTRIDIVVPGEDHTRASCELDGLGYSLYYTDEGFVIVTDEALLFLDSSLNLRAAKPHNSTPAMTHCSGKYITRIETDGILGNSYYCEIYDMSARLIYSGDFTGKLMAVDSDETGDYVFILAGNQVIRINLYNKKIGYIDVEADAFDILPQDADSFLLAMKNYALTYDVEIEEAYYERGDNGA